MEKDDSTDIFIRNIRRFAGVNENFSSFISKLDLENLTSVDVDKLYIVLANALLDPRLTIVVAECFPQDVLHFISIAIDVKGQPNVNFDTHIRNCLVLSKLIRVHPDVESFIIKYFDKYPAPFSRRNGTQEAKRLKMDNNQENDNSEFEIINMIYTFLQYIPKYLKTKWNWSIFMEKYCNYEDNMIKWIFCQCVGLITGMNEVLLHQFIKKHLSEEIVYECCLNYQYLCEKLTKRDINSINIDTDCALALKQPKSQKLVVNVSGLYLPTVSNVEIVKRVNIVEVESTKSNLKQIALGILSNKGINLIGPVGSGKTVLVEYLAEKTGRVLGEKFIKIQLGDQTDSKVLLGTYRCTDIPGEFVWQPGVLTQAVMDGSWLLLEDIDSASLDIASVLCSLLENGYLTVPGYRDCVSIASGFQLFVTQRLLPSITGYHKSITGATSLLDKQLMHVNILPLTTTELELIIKTLHPKLTTITNRIINIFKYLTENVNKNLNSLDRSGRYITTRDLFKWCSRAVIDFDVASAASGLKILQDAIDVFCCFYSNSEERLNLSKQICSELGIVTEKVNFFTNQYKPNLNVVGNTLKSERAVIKCIDICGERNAQFCFTRAAACLVERVMCCISGNEPVLLVGETGTGKTSTIQYLSRTLGQKLIVINMNQQSDSADLLGGFKPTDFKFIISPIRAQFEQLFASCFNVTENKKFLGHIAVCFNTARYADLLKLMKASYSAAIKKLSENKPEEVNIGKKRRRSKQTKISAGETNLETWTDFGIKLEKLELQMKHKNALAFTFIEGSLIRAIEKGFWVLLDEINLANVETLDCLSGLLEGPHSSISLLERGDKTPIKRHPNFLLFACMNPSTDVGKRNLPAGLRNRFTELFVDELIDEKDLVLLVNSYLGSMSASEKLENVVKFYLKVRREADTNLCDGLGHKPHFSLRSLCRALVIASKNPCGSLPRSLYEAFCLSFLTQLDQASYRAVETMIARYMVGTEKQLKAILKQPIPKPHSAANDDCLQFEGYWITRGEFEPQIPVNYILTSSVRKNLKDLTRIVSIGRLPVLLQGDTSVGKTSLITYLAKSSGNKCMRINNHEHTDLQEYIGSYVADISGKLVFREGVLVEAMRKGHWIILDELNLAPSDVLEALNRVLDDNRELFIPETQQVVKAHPNFMLFATQNPPGTYGGRKMLSRAFRNRFVELHFTEIPAAELETILQQRCELAPSYAKKIINVMKDLQTRRRGSAAFAGKHGFITLRDLFRWGDRYRLAEKPSKLYDWDQHLADEGYLVLAGKVRKEEEKLEISAVIQKHLKRTADPQKLFTLSENTSSVTKNILEEIERTKQNNPGIVWTYNMRQMAVLVSKALHFSEPVLIVGETGCGKTTVCDIIARNNAQKLVTINCHMHTESSDFIGGLRPIRDHSNNDINKLFEWVDGPLIEAMKDGNLFLIDEISLADDSVLERLNSLLEPERTLLLAEKGIDINNQSNSELIQAHENFHFIGTMNPGGDYGKKELSPALRNRFTEIWSEPCSNRQDFVDIINHNVKTNVLDSYKVTFGDLLMDFIEWFKKQEIGKHSIVSVRDILTWVHFINACANKLSIQDLYIHGAHITLLDSIGSGLLNIEGKELIDRVKLKCKSFLEQLLKKYEVVQNTVTITDIQINNDQFTIGPFSVTMGDNEIQDYNFKFDAPTTFFNTLRVVRGMQLNKAILLEGSPGVGKTSLVTALAHASKNKLYRINLSDQTDISDLFGADLPVEGGQSGQFSWRDGPLLQALKQGHWILLDELNLASQSVLEGLNACLDHRGEIFIPELGKTFHVTPGTKFFACQNPTKQGGSRRGLPKSFLNRFTQVYVESLTSEDYICILKKRFGELGDVILEKMVDFNMSLVTELSKHSFGHTGGPWEYNLRDLTRWCEVVKFQFENNPLEEKCYAPESFVRLIYSTRMRKVEDRKILHEIFEKVFGSEIPEEKTTVYVTKTSAYVGDVCLDREVSQTYTNILENREDSLVLRNQMNLLRNLCYCVNMNWMALLVGQNGSGKTSVVRTLAGLAGKVLLTLPVTSAMDTSDLLGGFEQTDYTRHLEDLSKQTEALLYRTLHLALLDDDVVPSIKLLERWEKSSRLLQQVTRNQTMSDETELFGRKVEDLFGVWEMLECHQITTDIKENMSVLKEKGQLLMKSLKVEGSLNAGGKFEWVDSILIKCLQNGYWLLVDNVNLCSPAVLDRLNALLEPNGVLTVSERGVDSEGKMIEIKPHKDFRLFFTMNPKNGEISRAMRNRGIELFILNENENLEKSNDIDLKSLIHSNGVNDDAIVNCLINLHEFISDLVLGEKPSMNHILQASFLISQQLKRGIKAEDAVSTAVIDIYCKSRPDYEFNTNDPTNIINLKIIELLEDKASRTDFFNPSSTLRIFELNSNSELTQIRQQCSLFEKYNRSEMTAYYIFNHYYSITSLDDLTLRYKYFRLLAESKQLNDFKHLNEIFYNYLRNVQENITILPLEQRWLPNTNYSMNNNKLSLGLYFLTLKFICELGTKETKIKSNKVLTILDYIKKIEENIYADRINDIVIREIATLLNDFDLFVLKVCTEYSAEFSNSDHIEIISLLQWRIYIYKKLEQNINNIKELKLREILSELHVHYKWFVKYCLNKFKTLLNLEENKNITRIINKINASLTTHFSLMQKVGKQYKKTIASPPPIINKEQLNITVKYSNICNTFDFYRRTEDSKKILATFLNNKEIYSKLRSLKSEINYKTFEEPENLLEISKFHDEFINSSDTVETLQSDFELLTILDYFAMLSLYKTRCNFNDNILIDAVTIPNSLFGALRLFTEENDERLLYEIDGNATHYLLHALCTVPNRFIGNFEENKKLHWHMPIFSYLITNILVNDGSNSATVSTKFGDYRQSASLYNKLNLMIWSNMYTMSSIFYDILKLEFDYITKTYKDLGRKLAKSLGIEGADDDLLQLCMTEIQERSQASGRNDKLIIIDLIYEFEQNLTLFPIYIDDQAIDKINIIGNCYILISYIKAILNSKLSPIDPFLKTELRRKYVDLELCDFKHLKESYQLQNQIFSTSQFSLCSDLNNKIYELQEKSKELQHFIAIRPENERYESIVQDVQYAFSTVLSEESILQYYSAINNAINMIKIAMVQDKVIDVSDYTKLLTREIATSIENFSEMLHKYRATYPDIVEALYSNVMGVIYGLRLKGSVLRKHIARYKNQKIGLNLEDTLLNLVRFPSLCDNQRNSIEVTKTYIEENLQRYVLEILNAKEHHIARTTQFRLIKCAIIETYNAAIIDAKYLSSITDPVLVEHLDDLFGKCVLIWHKQQQELEDAKVEEDSLYKMKTKCDDKSEEEQIQEEFDQLFPTYQKADFKEFQEQKLEDSVMPQESKKPIPSIRLEDMKQICDTHKKFMQIYSNKEWLKASTPSDVCNFVVPLMEKYKLYKLLLENSVESLDYHLDKKVLSSLCILVNIAQNFGNTNDATTLRKPFDFYHDSNVEEVKCSYHILKELEQQIETHLNEWPDHPTLQDIITIVKRIYGFDILSPLARFLAGFEILLTKTNEWEQNAHSGVSLQAHITNITQQIITWRKLELNMWKDSLDITFERMNLSIAKWWCYLYNITVQFESGKITPHEVITAIQTFITKSNLAEFKNRLELLFTFHCYSVQKSQKLGLFSNILWNMYHYYAQFLPNVVSKIKELRDPIEKKMKGFVKIVRWKDISYWAVKDTMMKTHKTIHKHMREFEHVLQQPVYPHLNLPTQNTDPSSVGIWDKASKSGDSASYDDSIYITNSSIVDLPNLNPFALGNILQKRTKYFTKCKLLSKKIITSAPYTQLTKDLDDYISQVITTSIHLQNLEINKSLPKSKQKSQAKSILQQKRRCLADLFKTLSKIGLSHRTGILESKTVDEARKFMIKPIDLEHLLLKDITTRKCDEKVLQIWNGCEPYYSKSLIKLDILQAALINPSKDLGMSDVERCKGFPINLMNVIYNEKERLIDSSEHLYSLRLHIQYFKEFCSDTDFVSRRDLIDLFDSLKNSITVLEQYKIILETCPEQNSVEYNLKEVPILLPEVTNGLRFKHDELWNNCMSFISSGLNTVNKILGNFKNNIIISQNYQLELEYVPVRDVGNLLKDIQEVEKNLKDVQRIFGDIPLSSSVRWIRNEISQCRKKISKKQQGSNNTPIDNFKENNEELVKRILCSVQNVFKKFQDLQETNQEKPEDNLQDDHIKIATSGVFDCLSLLNIKGILESILKIKKNFSSLTPDSYRPYKDILSNTLPFLDQILLLHQYFFTQQVGSYRITAKINSVLLNIFIDLATKGFCIPPELSDEISEEGSTQQSGGMGLGDGEGEKDVSDKIESEDQLEDAQPDGESKNKEEDKDNKEEDKGIEMSDDFDSKLQDVEKTGDEDEEDDNDSDADEQMGETEKGADQLDEEIWGTDNESEGENDGEENSKEEKGDGGESLDDHQMGAKEDETNEQGDQDGSKPQEVDKEINEMDENEIDDDQVDPYHGNQQENPEPEPMDLPDDLQLEDDDGKEDNDNPEDNPFDIDEMKDKFPPPPEEEEKKDDQADEDTEQQNDTNDGDDHDEENGDKDAEEIDPNNDNDKLDNLDDDAPENDPDNVEDVAADGLDQTNSKDDEAQPMDVDENINQSKDNAQTTESNDQNSAEKSETTQDNQKDSEGVGQSQSEQTEGGNEDTASIQPQSDSSSKSQNQNKRQKLGESDSKRTLGDTSEPIAKKLKTMQADNREDNAEDKLDEKQRDADMYQHIKEADKNKPQVLDAATKEQIEEQKIVPDENEAEDTNADDKSTEDLPTEDEEDVKMTENAAQKPQNVGDENEKKSDKRQHPDGDILQELEAVEIEGDVVQTMQVERGHESFYNTQFSETDNKLDLLSIEERNNLRLHVEQQLSTWTEPPSTETAQRAWEKISAVTSSLAYDLAEQLRLVLEPTQASRLKGDFRTGKRINMRKIIPYIASQFRKDKIWLRRTKPAKREYQIVLAIDDSSSMDDNHSKELAFESVALISRALTLLESGQLSILSFGEKTEVLHKLSDPFTERSGSKLLQKFQFAEKKTCIGQMVNFATEMLNSSGGHSNVLNAKLLVVVSDGRGIFSEGESYVQQAIRNARVNNVFMIFVIIDNPKNKDSILDIRRAVFKGGTNVEVLSYMDSFPFPYYLILRDINSLPSVLSDALHQWFEMISSNG